jgi:hypothetical protein
MNCHDSRTILDAAAPHCREAADVEVRDAASHAETCPECSRWLSAADGFDRWVAPAFRGVTVPDGLRDRLLQRLMTDSASTRQPVAPSRRKLLVGVSTEAALLIGLGVWSFMQGPDAVTELTLAAACEKLDAQRPFTSLKAFDGSFAPALPGRFSPWVSGGALGVDLDAAAGHDAAIYRFTAGEYSGYLVVIAAGRVSDPPKVAIPHSSQTNYQMQRVSWTSADQVVVCYLEDDGPRMEDFLRDLYPQSA